jgi:hypothetical protein
LVKAPAARAGESTTRGTQTGREDSFALDARERQYRWAGKLVMYAGPDLATATSFDPKQHIDPGGARSRWPRTLFPGRYRAHLCPQHERTDPLPRYELSPRHVVEARYLGDYKVWLEFNDGRKGVVDLADDLYGDTRAPLRNREIFSSFYLDYGLASIAWCEGLDFAPEFLYERLKEMH